MAVLKLSRARLTISGVMGGVSGFFSSTRRLLSTELFRSSHYGSCGTGSGSGSTPGVYSFGLSTIME